jgi:hypothetical protein
MDMMIYYDTDFNGFINEDDMWTEGAMLDFADLCDRNDDGSIDECEARRCLLETENAYRMENCPGYPLLQCEECPP